MVRKQKSPSRQGRKKAGNPGSGLRNAKALSRREFVALSSAGLLATWCPPVLATTADGKGAQGQCRGAIESDPGRFTLSVGEGGERRAIPIGNGIVGASVWISKEGSLEFYVARTDAFTEIDRNVHLAKVSIGIVPLVLAASDASCTLDLQTGHLEVKSEGENGRFVATLFIDKDSGAIVIRAVHAKRLSFSVKPVVWRREAGAPPYDAVLPGAKESADVVLEASGCLVAYHRNAFSCVPELAASQVPGFEYTVPDPYVNRTFGIGIYSLTGEAANQGALSFSRSDQTTIVVNTSSEQEPSLDKWLSRITRRVPSASTIDAMSQSTSRWWKEYWQRSWVRIGTPGPAETGEDRGCGEHAGASLARLDQAYAYTKYMTACASGGSFPISYNGSLFSMMPTAKPPLRIEEIGSAYDGPVAAEPTQELNPDCKIWGGSGYLWQNTRLSYHSMVARGEFDAIHRSLFAFYNRFASLDRARAKLYWGASGQHSTEMTLACGLQPGGIYGMDRSGKPPYLTDNRWGGAVEISPGLERLFMMLEVYDHTGDRAFLRQEVLPYAHDLFAYIFTRFAARKDGKVVLAPLHSIETYWDVVDPMPTIAGMHACLRAILALGHELIGNPEPFARYLEMTPALPADGDGLLPCLEPLPKRMNVETPELYAIHPFRLFGVGKPSIDLARKTFVRAMEVSGSFRAFGEGMTPRDASFAGWQQVGLNAALLGNREQAAQILVANASRHNKSFAFPAMWGPIYDALPDVDHGANILNQVQLMLMQCHAMADGGRIFLLPAWPLDWDVSFRLFAPGGTVVEVDYSDRSLRKASVHPVARLASIVLPEGLQLPKS